MINEWNIRTYKGGDEAGIVELMNIVFPRSKYTVERWLWEYRNNPYGFTTVVCEHKGEIIGNYSGFFMNLKIGDHNLRGSQACDVCVHPEFRGKGIYVDLMKAYRRAVSGHGISFSIGFPNTTAREGAVKAGQWFDITRIPVLATYFDAWDIVAEKHPKLSKIDPVGRKFSTFGDSLLDQIRRKRQYTSRPPDDFRIVKTSLFDISVNELWDRVSHNYGNSTVRNCTYLNWRYSIRPDVHYDIFLAERKGQAEGYLVTSTQRLERAKIGYIVDIIASSREVFLGLVRTSIELLRRQSVSSIECMMLRDQLWYKALSRMGFFPYLKRKRNFIGQVNSHRFLQSYDGTKAWYVTYGDSDHV